jgi:hypothetical protein
MKIKFTGWGRDGRRSYVDAEFTPRWWEFRKKKFARRYYSDYGFAWHSVLGGRATSDLELDLSDYLRHASFVEDMKHLGIKK